MPNGLPFFSLFFSHCFACWLAGRRCWHATTGGASSRIFIKPPAGLVSNTAGCWEKFVATLLTRVWRAGRRAANHRSTDFRSRRRSRRRSLVATRETSSAGQAAGALACTIKTGNKQLIGFKSLSCVDDATTLTR